MSCVAPKPRGVQKPHPAIERKFTDDRQPVAQSSMGGGFTFRARLSIQMAIDPRGHADS
jgi:hypothetical protein